MRRVLFEVLLLVAVALLGRVCLTQSREGRRLKSNQEALTAEITHYQQRLGGEIASVQALRLRCEEYEVLRARDAEEIRSLGLKIRRLEAAARTTLQSEVRAEAPLHDSLTPLLDTLRLFRWQDPWVEVEGALQGDSVACRIRSVDTLVQVVHRIPHRFLFIRWGTKALRQEIHSKNPHTQIVAAEYIQIER